MYASLSANFRQSKNPQSFDIIIVLAVAVVLLLLVESGWQKAKSTLQLAQYNCYISDARSSFTRPVSIIIPVTSCPINPYPLVGFACPETWPSF